MCNFIFKHIIIGLYRNFSNIYNGKKGMKNMDKEENEKK